MSYQNVLSEAKQSLVNIARDQHQYPKILEGLIAQVNSGAQPNLTSYLSLHGASLLSLFPALK